MKRYETMSKEEIVGFFEHCKTGRCKNCAGEGNPGVLRMVCACAYLQEEVPEPLMVRRYQNICCKQDLDEAFESARKPCYLPDTECTLCEYYHDGYCMTRRFIDYLCELEPEREKEWYLDEKYHKNGKQKA